MPTEWLAAIKAEVKRGRLAVLECVGEEVGFAHLSYQEHLAGEAVAMLVRGGRGGEGAPGDIESDAGGVGTNLARLRTAGNKPGLAGSGSAEDGLTWAAPSAEGRGLEQADSLKTEVAPTPARSDDGKTSSGRAKLGTTTEASSSAGLCNTGGRPR